MLEEDLPGVLLVEKQMQGYWNFRQWSDELQIHGAVCLVAEVDVTVVGFVSFRCVEEEAELMRIAVLQGCQRIGIGTKLLLTGLSELARKKVKTCFLEVRLSNGAGQSLYSALGFWKIGLRPKYYSHPVEDAVLMQLDLNSDSV